MDVVRQPTQGWIEVVVGLAPADRRGRPTFGGGTRLTARSPRGLAIGASFRGLGQAREDHRLTRLRVGVDVGWIGRERALEWAVGLGPTAEPWLVTQAGERRALGRTSGSGASELWGGALFVALGYRIEMRRPGALRIGATTELAASVLGNGAAARVWLAREPEAPQALFALGGLELWFGLDATLWFELPRPGRARRVPSSRRSPAERGRAADLRPAPGPRASGPAR